ncbi:hypothetical protein [Asanoa iriomotensis]|uniref:Uncharacterized protein n=1 Tax=Asanoa iriomotensis TaxID=234613 RepID=A0ABQ4CCU4_9ACTN|nr:hypothetical protein [Asanoa iriomotensis]GIF60590.1 hypothetical protein Air01nite_66850 [Asanoa iriomotensis]
MDKLIVTRARELEDAVIDRERPTTWISRTRAVRNHRRAVDERALVLAAYERSEAAAKAAADVARHRPYRRPLSLMRVRSRQSRPGSAATLPGGGPHGRHP